MSKELLQLMKLVKTSQYKESPPKKILYEILHEIETQQHYGAYRNWEILVELLANWIVQNEDLTLGSCACKAFDGLELRYKDLYNHINNLDLFKHYVTALKEQPWDYLGEIYMDQELVGLGENMTPRAIVELMVGMVFDKRKMDGEAEWFTYNSYLNYITWYTLTHHTPPRHLKPMDPPIHTQLDPCVGTGRFLIVTSQMFPKANLVLFGIEINLSLYRACLVNMALLSKHPYSIICADALRLDPDKSGPTSPIWELGNRWTPPDISAFYWKPPPIWHDRFSLDAFTKMKQGK